MEPPTFLDYLAAVFIFSLIVASIDGTRAWLRTRRVARAARQWLQEIVRSHGRARRR